jgi:6-phosphogluconolactonase
VSTIEIIENASVPQIAEAICGIVRDALTESEGPVAIAVPGGSTPFPIMERIAQSDLDFPRLVVWPGDDRVVPPDHPASNEGRIRAIFEPAGAEVATLSIMEQVPQFALVWLGMGEDGHVASLFPNTDPQIDASQAITRITPDPLPPEAPFDRVSLTLPALLNSGRILFTLGGSEAKRRVFDEARAGANDLPIARLLAAAEQQVTCFA